MEENLQLEEAQKSNQQISDTIPHDPNSTSRFPAGYTPVGEGEDNTQTETVDSGLVNAVEVTIPQQEENRNDDVFGSSGDFIIADSIENVVSETLEPLQFSLTSNDFLDFIPNTDRTFNSSSNSFTDTSNQDQQVKPEPPVEPEDPDSKNENNGFGNGDQDAPGNSLDNNNAENDQTPGEQGNSHQNDNGNGGSGGNNGFGNGDQDAPGNSRPNNNAENSQSPNSNIGDLIDKFVEENPGTEWHDNFHNEFEVYDNYEPESDVDVNIPDCPEIVIDFEVPDYAANTDSFDFS